MSPRGLLAAFAAGIVGLGVWSVLAAVIWRHLGN